MKNRSAAALLALLATFLALPIRAEQSEPPPGHPEQYEYHYQLQPEYACTDDLVGTVTCTKVKPFVMPPPSDADTITASATASTQMIRTADGSPFAVLHPDTFDAPATGGTEPSPAPSPAAPTITAKVSGGAMADYGQETGTNTTYTFRVETDARLTDFERGPRLRTLTDLTQLPGSSAPATVPDPSSTAFDAFQALEFSAAAVVPLPKMRFGLYAGAGFASRFQHDPNVPATKAPRWGCLGAITFDPGSAGELSAALCRDQRLDDGTNPDPVPYQWAAEFAGRIDLWKKDVGDGRQVVASLTGSVILGLDATKFFPDRPELTGGRHDIIRAGVMLSYGR